jgi:hypothetical protein
MYFKLGCYFAIGLFLSFRSKKSTDVVNAEIQVRRSKKP